MALQLMAFTADVARAIQSQGGRVTKIIVEASEGPEYPNSYYIRIEDGTRWAAYWVSDNVYRDRELGPPLASSVARYLLRRLEIGDPVKMHVPGRLERGRKIRPTCCMLESYGSCVDCPGHLHYHEGDYCELVWGEVYECLECGMPHTKSEYSYLPRCRECGSARLKHFYYAQPVKLKV